MTSSSDLDRVSTEGDAPTVSPFELLRVVWERKWIVAVVTVLCMVAALAFGQRGEKQYSSSATLLFRDPGFARTLFGNDLFDPGQDPKRASQTTVDVISSSSVAAEARRSLRSNESIGSLLDSVTVDPSSDADVATIKATRSTPEDAAAVANAFAQGYITYRQQADRATIAQAADLLRQSLAAASPAQQGVLQRSLSNLDTLETLQTGNAEVIARATPDPSPVSPKPKRDALLGMLLGLLLGCGLALLVDRLDRRLRTRSDVEHAYRAYPVLAAVPSVRGRAPAQLTGPAREAYRMLREGLRFLDPSGAAHCFVVTSADESEGKSTVSVNLALSLAAVGQRVILLEADMRRPAAAAQLGLPRDLHGLSDFLISDVKLEEFLVDGFEYPTLDVLPSGTVPPDPSDLLRAGRIGDALADARAAADVVIVDAPPLLPVADTRVLLQQEEIDGVILVGRVGVTRRDRAAEARRVMSQSGRRVFGLVVTGSDESLASSYYDTPDERKRSLRHPGRVKDPV